MINPQKLKRILVVDDELIIAEIIKDALDIFGLPRIGVGL